MLGHCRLPNSIPISCSQQLNLDGLLCRLWDMMALVRVYTKRVGRRPDFADPVVLSQVIPWFLVQPALMHLEKMLRCSLADFVIGTQTLLKCRQDASGNLVHQ